MNHPQNLRRCRNLAGMSLAETAKHMGVSEKTISRWEKGENDPSLDNLKRLANLYGVSIDELINHELPYSPAPETAHSGRAAIEFPTAEASETTVSTPVSTAQKLPLRYKIALCSAVALCVLFAAMFTANKIKQAREEPIYDIHVTQDETQTDQVTLNPNQGFDLVIPDE